jgi:glycosyltransferase involved in cell wall biosynthesis
MKILHLANHCHEIGNGIMNVAVDLACKQAEAGHVVAYASASGSYVELLNHYGVTHFDVEQPWRKPIGLVKAYLKLRATFEAFNPDIVHAHMVTGAVLARVLRRRSGFRLVTTVHNDWQRQAILMGVGDRVIAVSKAVAENMHARGVSNARLRIVKNGPLGSPRRPPPTDDNHMQLEQPAIVTVSGLFHRKGIADLIAAFDLIQTQFSAAHLYIIGDGPDRTIFEAQAAQTRAPQQIHFLGFQKDPRPFLAQTEVFVLASRADPMPLVIPEAREAGCAIVATRVDGIPEGLDQGRAGLLVPPQNPAVLAKTLTSLLNDPEERAAWRNRSRQNLEWLQVSRCMHEVLDVYEDALAIKAKPATHPLLS